MRGRTLLCAALLATLLCLSCRAESDEIYSKAMEEAERIMPDSARAYLEDRLDEGNGDDINLFDSLVKTGREIIESSEQSLTSALRCFGGFAVVLALTSSVSAAAGAALGGSARQAVAALSVLGAAAAVSKATEGFFESSSRAIEAAGQYAVGFVPLFAGVMVSAAEVTAATVFSATLAAVASIISTVAQRGILPMCGVLLALSLVGIVSDNGLAELASGGKKALNWVLGIATTLYFGLAGLQKNLAVASDSMALKTGRYVVGSAVPLVGSSISEALGAVSAGVRLAKNGIGVAGITAFMAIFLPVIIEGLLLLLSLKVCGLLAGMLSNDPLRRAAAAIGGCLETIEALLCCYFAIIAITIGGLVGSAGV